MTKLIIYNEALRMCGERKLASLSENREPRRVLDAVWDGGALDYCLEQGQWNFALRAAKLTKEESAESQFGYKNIFQKPADLIRLTAICSDPYLQNTIQNYTEEAGLWLCDLDEIYVQHVSNDSAFGGDISLWPPGFRKYVSTYLASEIVGTLTQDQSKWDRVFKLMKHYGKDARSKDAMGQPSKPAQSGSWSRSRMSSSGDRGNGGRLIG